MRRKFNNFHLTFKMQISNQMVYCNQSILNALAITISIHSFLMQYTASKCTGASPQKSHRYTVYGLSAVNSQNSHTATHHARTEPQNHGIRNSISSLMQCTFEAYDVIDVIPIPCPMNV